LSAQVTVSEPAPRHRSIVVEALLLGGPLSVALVAIGGLSLGFAAWYASIVSSASLSAVGDGLLIVTLPLGIVAAFWGWATYSDYFARRAGVDRRTALRYDAWSWCTLSVFVLGVLVPLGSSGMGRAITAGIGLWALVKLLVAARFNKTVRDTTITFVVTRIPIIFIAELASVIIAQRPGEHVSTSTNPLLAVWGRWDAVHYLDISSRGYYGTDMAFFPLYPALIHVLGRLVGNDLVAGLLISNVAFFFGLLFFYRLVEHQLGRSVALRAIFYVSIFPTAVFFSAVYTESLFFALTVASFYYIRERNWLLAGVLGALAALTRVEGVLLAVPYAMEAWSSVRAHRDAGEPDGLPRLLGGFVLIPLGLGIYMAMLWVLRGDPLFFSHVQVHWHRYLAPPWASVTRSLYLIFQAPSAAVRAGQAIELVFTLFMLGVLVGGVRLLRPSLWIYMALSILIPMSTSSLMSMPRFALALFPMFIVLAQWGSRNWVNSTIVAFSLPLLGLFTVLFANWYWVA
jgi:hypothetical protein